MNGPLRGVRVVEMAGLGPAPFAAMMLADLGADVIRVERPRPTDSAMSAADPVNSSPTSANLLNRGRRSIAVDLKQPEGKAVVVDLIRRSDILLEGFRPGVMERLGVGPDDAREINPQLVYGRMTGWGQDGPLAHAAGHDLNYIALAGVLAHIGAPESGPIPPLNLVGDFGGGGMMLAFGVLAALIERQQSGLGQVVDAAMVDGAAILMTSFWGMLSAGAFDASTRSANVLDGGAPFYAVYRCKDGEYVSIASAEPQFFVELVTKLDDDLGVDLLSRLDRANWPELRSRLETIFATRSQREWCELLEGSDVCFAPVLAMPDAVNHPHMAHRGTFVEIEGIRQPGPSPRFSRTAAEISHGPVEAGHDSTKILTELGRTADEIEALLASGAVSTVSTSAP